MNKPETCPVCGGRQKTMNPRWAGKIVSTPEDEGVVYYECLACEGWELEGGIMVPTEAP